MDDICIFNWQPVAALPLFSATIKVMLEETEQQYYYIKHLKTDTQIESDSINRILIFYHIQLNKIMYYNEQLERWLKDSSSHNKILNDISILKKNMKEITKITHSIIKFAEHKELKYADSKIIN